MNYPRIYSFSTVGILRHYNQDYLIHETRTDFTGSNGVGKSMIADLLQIIFIPYRHLIKFGTEGISKRRLSDLPYQMSEAYTFLNIEVSEDRYITVGTCISQNEKGSPTPFLILNDEDTHKNLHELSYSGEHIPFQRHFIDNNHVVDSKDLARHFRDKYQTYLVKYSTQEKKNEFFLFLYNKEILPINLSIEENIKAFSKVIQSFSRAKSLDVHKSKSLKEFLFEDEISYDQAFRKHKDDLQSLLLDYKRLETDIEILEKKQSALRKLKVLEKNFKDIEKNFFIIDYKYTFQNRRIIQEKFEKYKRELSNTQEEINFLEKRQQKLEKILKISHDQIEKYRSSIDILESYNDEYKTLQLIKNEISEINLTNSPNIDEKILTATDSIEIDIVQLDHKEIIQRITKFNLVYQKYGSFSEIESHYHQQYEILEEHKRNLQEDIQRLKTWIGLLSSDKGLLAKVIERGESLSEGQEAALFHLLDVYWQKPVEVKKGERFTESLTVLDIDNIETDEHNNGFWVKLGDLSEFFPKTQEQLLNNPDMFEKLLQSKIDSFKGEMNTAETRLAELRQFEKGEVLSVSFLQLDSNLRDATSFDYLKQTAIIIQSLEKRINLLESQRQEKIDILQRLSETIPFSVETNDIKKQRENKKKSVIAKETRHAKIEKIKTQEDTKLKLLLEKDYPRQTDQVDSYKSVYTDADLLYHEKENERLKLNVHIITDEQESVTEKDLNKLKDSLDTAKTIYQDSYRDISSHFQETTEGSNSEVNEQINDKLYEFSMLEHVLLGSKIKYVDNLPDVLRESNRQREKIATSIHASMLRIFSATKDTFDNHRSIVRGLNNFFKNKRISGKYTFRINFIERTDIDITWIDELSNRLANVHQSGGLPFGESVETFVEDFFKQISGYERNIDVYTLLDAKTYFDLTVSLRDDSGKDYSGSTGETYSAIVLLGIGRLSIVQKTERKGIRFVILEETANLDQTNFNHFPEIAQEFGYQIITMTPRPYGSDSEDGWYLYHLLPSKDHPDINNDPLGYFKTNREHKDLKTYLNALEKR